MFADAINGDLGQIASATDAVTISIAAPVGAETRSALMSRIENLLVDPAEAAARVVVNARTGTVVINGAVRISPAAVSHSKLTVSVEANPLVVKPEPFSRGRPAVQEDSNTEEIGTTAGRERRGKQVEVSGDG